MTDYVIARANIFYWFITIFTKNHMPRGKTWCPSHQHIRGFNFSSLDFLGEFCHVAKVGDIGPVVRKNGRWKRLDFSKPRRTHTQRFPGNTRGFNSTANRSIAQLFHCLASPPRAFTRASTRHEISLVNRKKSASSRCATSSLSISEF